MRSTAQLVALAVLTLAAQGRSQTRPVPADSAAIVRLEDGWARALVKRDKGYFERNLGRGFIYTEDSTTASREDVLGGIVTPEDTVSAARNEAMVVHRFGASTAVVTGLLVVEGRAKGAKYRHRYKFTDTWVKQPDGWRI